MASLLCIRDMDDDPKVFQTLELPFSTPSVKGHEVPLSIRFVDIVLFDCKNELMRWLCSSFQIHANYISE